MITGDKPLTRRSPAPPLVRAATAGTSNPSATLNPYRAHTKELAEARQATEAMDRIQLACQDLVMSADFASYGITAEASIAEGQRRMSESSTTGGEGARQRTPTPMDVKEQVRLALKDCEFYHPATDDAGHTATDMLADVIDNLNTAVVDVGAAIGNSQQSANPSKSTTLGERNRRSATAGGLLSAGIIGFSGSSARTDPADSETTADAAWPEMAASFIMLRELLELTRLQDVPTLSISGDKPVAMLIGSAIDHRRPPMTTSPTNKRPLIRNANPGDEFVSIQWVNECLKSVRSIARRVMMSVQQFSYSHGAALQLLNTAQSTNQALATTSGPQSQPPSVLSPNTASPNTVPIPKALQPQPSESGVFLWCTSLAATRKMKAHLLGPEFDMTRAMFRALVRGVVNRSLSGRVICEGEDGTCFMIVFRSAWEALTFDACLQRFAMYLPWPKACLALSYAGEQPNPAADVTAQALAKDSSDWVTEAARKIDILEVATNSAKAKESKNTLPQAAPAVKAPQLPHATTPDTFIGTATKQSFTHAEVKEIRNLRSRVTATENLFIGQVELLNGQAEARTLELRERQAERNRQKLLRESKLKEEERKKKASLGSPVVAASDPDFETAQPIDQNSPRWEIDGGPEQVESQPVEVDYIPKPPPPAPGSNPESSSSLHAAGINMARYSVYARRGPVIRSALHLAGEDPKFTAVSSMQLVAAAMASLSDGFATLLGPHMMNKNSAMVLEALKCQTNEAALDGVLLEGEDKESLLSEPNLMSIADLKGNGVGYLYGVVWHNLRFRKRKASKDFNPTAVADRWWWCTRTVPTLAASIQGTTTSQGFTRGTQTIEEAPAILCTPEKEKSGSKRSSSPNSKKTKGAVVLPAELETKKDEENVGQQGKSTPRKQRASIRPGTKKVAKRAVSPLQPPEPSPTPLPTSAEVGCQTRNGSADIAPILQLRDSLTKAQMAGSTTPNGRRRSIVPNASELTSRAAIDQKVAAFSAVQSAEPSSFNFNGFTAATMKSCSLLFEWLEGRSTDDEVISFLERYLLKLDDSSPGLGNRSGSPRRKSVSSPQQSPLDGFTGVSELNISSASSHSVFEAALQQDSLFRPSQMDQFQPFGRAIPTCDTTFAQHSQSPIADMLLTKWGMSTTGGGGGGGGGSPVNSPSTAISSPTGMPKNAFPSPVNRSEAFPLRIPKPQEATYKSMSPSWKRIANHYRNILASLGGPLSTDDGLVAGAGIAAIFHMVAELLQDQARHCEDHRVAVHELQTELYNVTAAALKGPHATFVKNKIANSMAQTALHAEVNYRVTGQGMARSLGAAGFEY